MEERTVWQRDYLKKGYVESERDIVYGRNLVGSGASGVEVSRLNPLMISISPLELFQGEPSQSLDEGSFDLEKHGEHDRQKER